MALSSIPEQRIERLKTLTVLALVLGVAWIWSDLIRRLGDANHGNVISLLFMALALSLAALLICVILHAGIHRRAGWARILGTITSIVALVEAIFSLSHIPRRIASRLGDPVTVGGIGGEPWVISEQGSPLELIPAGVLALLAVILAVAWLRAAWSRPVAKLGR